jgi:Flp pilus assembly protein TadD
MKTLLFVFCTALLAGCGSQPASEPASASPVPLATMTFTSKSPEAIAHMQKGEVLADNQRQDEARAEFAEALKLDPDFAAARAALGQSTPGPEGLKEIEAAADSKDISEPERLMIEGVLAGRRGETSAAIDSMRRLTQVVPGWARGHLTLGSMLLNQRDDLDGALASLSKATQVDPNYGPAQNMLGYTALAQGDTEKAIVAFNEYVRILPQEPNPQDSLGEALLAAGRFKEAEAAFQKALELSPQFSTSHEGIAFARFYAGDWAGGRDALSKAKAGATQRQDKVGLDVTAAAAALAQGKTADALQILDGTAKIESLQADDHTFIAVRRAQVLVMSGRAREALVPIAAAIKTIDSGVLPPGAARFLRRQALVVRVAAEAQVKDVAAVKKTSAELDMEANATPGIAPIQSAMHFGRGLLAVASGDAAGARAHFDQCSRIDEWCKWEGVLAADKAGDKAGATAARDTLLKLYLRNPTHLIVRSRLTQPTS